MTGTAPRTRVTVFVLLSILVSLLARGATAGCECGFKMADTGDYFTHVIYNNYTLYASGFRGRGKKASSSAAFRRDWEVQRWGREPKNWASPLGIMNREENLFIKDGLLHLKQEAYTQADVLYGKNVSVASMSTARKDIIHGSFRVDMKLSNATGGSVVGFFWYKDDENEIDIEVLSREFKPDQMMVHYTTQPALDDKGEVIRNATEIVTFHGDHPGDHFQRHRFDWTPNELRFYNNHHLVHTNVAHIPDEAGQVHLNLWADGGPWSGSPSTSNVYLLIKAISIYHNTTLSEAGKDAAFNKQCQKAGGPSEKTICLDTMVEGGLHKKLNKGGTAPPSSPAPTSGIKTKSGGVVTRPALFSLCTRLGMMCFLGGVAVGGF